MKMNQYRYDTGSIIDQKEKEVLTVRKAVNRLNNYENLIREAYESERTSLGKSVLKQLTREPIKKETYFFCYNQSQPPPI